MSRWLLYLFPHKVYPRSVSLFLLFLRLMFGGLVMWHGIAKIVNFEALAETFPDPLALGHKTSLVLAIFAEAFCGLAVVAGAFYRLALIPLIFTMGVALFVVHAGQPFSYKEMAFIFLVMFLLLYVLGAGCFSLDDVVAERLHQKDDASSAG